MQFQRYQFDVCQVLSRGLRACSLTVIVIGSAYTDVAESTRSMYIAITTTTTTHYVMWCLCSDVQMFLRRMYLALLCIKSSLNACLFPILACTRDCE